MQMSSQSKRVFQDLLTRPVLYRWSCWRLIRWPGDDNAYFGTEPLFRRAGFQVVREPLKTHPRNWIARVTMRIQAPPGGAAEKP
jgi:hypothetical protein